MTDTNIKNLPAGNYFTEMQAKLKHIKIVRKDAGKYEVFGYDRDGRQYMNERVYCLGGVNRDKALDLIERITAAGMLINVQHWLVRSPYGTAAWLIDGMEEREIEDECSGFAA